MASVTGLEGVVAAHTEIGMVDGERGHLVYRGHTAQELAITRSFEETAFLLWHGRLPEEEELSALKKRLTRFRTLPDYVCRILELLPASIPLMSALQTAVAAMEHDEECAWPPSLEQAERLTAILPSMIAYRARHIAGLEALKPNEALGHAANYLYMLSGKEPERSHAKAIEAYLILGMEHGMNASTFASRVILSTQSDMNAAVSGAIGAMKGPLHGGAPYEVIAMLESIGSKSNAEPWMRNVLSGGGRLMGFGHRIYKTKDPRALALRAVTQQLTGDDPSFDLAIHVEDTAIRLLEEFKPGRRLYTNVEFYAAAIMRAVSISPELFTPTFTVGRIVGWTAHLLEQAGVNRIFRPQSVYIGPMPASLESQHPSA